MDPILLSGQLIIGSSLLSKKVNRVVIFNHKNLDKIKLISRIRDGKYFVLGINLKNSTDSRHFGWINEDQIIGVMVYPRIKK